jgi:hypothetical protein
MSRPQTLDEAVAEAQAQPGYTPPSGFSAHPDIAAEQRAWDAAFVLRILSMTPDEFADWLETTPEWAQED